MGGLLHLVQRGGAWEGCGHTQSPPCCIKCNSPPINGQWTNSLLFDVALRVPVKGLMKRDEGATTLSSDDLCDVLGAGNCNTLGHVSATSRSAAIHAVHQRDFGRRRARLGRGPPGRPGQTEAAEPGDEQAGPVGVRGRRERLVAGKIGHEHRGRRRRQRASWRIRR